MKKNLKAVLALVLALAMVFSFDESEKTAASQ